MEAKVHLTGCLGESAGNTASDCNMRVKLVEESIGFCSNLCMRFGSASESDRVEGKVT